MDNSVSSNLAPPYFNRNVVVDTSYGSLSQLESVTVYNKTTGAIEVLTNFEKVFFKKEDGMRELERKILQTISLCKKRLLANEDALKRIRGENT